MSKAFTTLPVITILLDFPVATLLDEPVGEHEQEDKAEDGLDNVGVSWS